MKRFKRIYLEARTLFRDVTRRRADSLGYSMTFSSKMACFEIMYREAVKKVKNLETVVREENSEHKIAFTRTTTALDEAIAFFEAYLNSLYSLLQIIAKFTPLFYEKSEGEIPDKNFGTQVNFFIKEHPEFDPEFSSYLSDSLTWYETFRNNRHATTHRLSAFFGFQKDGTVVFIDYPDTRKKEFDWLGKKTVIETRKYLDQSFNDMFDFLEFYAKHFRKRVPESERTKLLLRSVLQANSKQ